VQERLLVRDEKVIQAPDTFSVFPVSKVQRNPNTGKTHGY